ncbi:MAG: hypothetical protein H6867_11310 [Rhodospirillales bacterium]|nr:hypothetical protein [Rhodospirillales bacterium]MCB9996717.1 hypothetical protein [Rhodospirillales bacterium]
MSDQTAKAVTMQEFMRRGGGNGSGPGPDEERGLLCRFWTRWAEKLLNEKIEGLERDDIQLTPQQFVTLNKLKKEFDAVTLSPKAAYRAVREHSPLLNSPFVKPFLS